LEFHKSLYFRKKNDMDLLKNLVNFFSSNKITRSVNRYLVGANAPFIGSDDKTKYVSDFETVKYVYAVISWIAKKAARVPLNLYTYNKEGGKELIKVNQFLDRLDRPNEYQSSYQFLYQFYGFLLSTGAGYIYIPKLSSGRWTEMHIIPSNFVEPIYEKTFEGPARFLITDSGKTIDKSEMLFVFMEGLDLEQVGVGQSGNSPMNSLRTVTQKTKDIDSADLATIQNGGVAGIITDKSATEGLTDVQRAKAEKILEDKAYGGRNKGKWFLTAGDVSFIPLGLSPVDLNLYEANTQVLRDICIVYNVPFIIFDMSNTNASFGTALKEAKKQAYLDTVLPLVDMFTTGMNHYGIEGFGKGFWLECDEGGIKEIQTDSKLKAETLAIEYWKTIGQKQKESGMQIDEKYKDVYLVPSGLVRMDEFDIEASYQKAKSGMNEIGKLFE
jgi:HK97 family phage portal protein